MYLLDVSNPELILWTKVEYAPGSPVPPGRGYECSVYSEILDAFFLYGGLVYTSNFSSILFRADTWVFHFSNLTWTLLDEVASPGYRVGHECQLDITGENVIMLHGIASNTTEPITNTSVWNLATNTWTNLPLATYRPSARWLFGFQRIPGSNNFLMVNGRLPRSPVLFTDIWVLNGDTFEWTELTVSNVPNPPHEVAVYALTSAKWLLMSGGDADNNKTVADTCKPPLLCRTVVSPKDTNFFLRLRLDSSRADWEDEAGFDHTLTPHRHASLIIMKPYLYFYGGFDWDGQHGIGEIYNTLTWAIKLSNKYWD
jgi:hypothetical protein